jgi:broad specificity phosphatase PhoE
MKRIIIIRHGETDYNINIYEKSSLMAQPVESKLNTNGIDQARKTGVYLQKFNEK